jgi:plastocyanin
MARRILLVLLALPFTLVLGAVPAVAGGGCHSGVTVADEGSTVAMAEACFTPTILHIDPGETVRFVNKDAMTHNVVANGWGHFDDLLEADDFTVSFDDPGVYPYACTYHPGMTGAVVVGDAEGAGNGEVIVVPEAGEGLSGATGGDVAAPAAASPVRSTDASDEGTTMPWVAGGAIGLVVGGAVGRLAGRRRAG